MRYGLNLPNGAVDPNTLAEFAALAEQAGWDGVFLEDYIVWQGDQEVDTYDPWVLLAAMATRTRRVRLGTMVTPLARRRPWKVAREAATLDHLSRGRMILGVGVGDTVSNDVSFTHFGEEIDLRKRAAMLDEALEVLAGLWSGEPYRHMGDRYQVAEVKLVPAPYQKPRIPIWVGGGYPLPGPTRRATRWDGSCLYRHGSHDLTPDDIRDLTAFVLEARGTLDGYDVVVGGTPRREDWDQERAHIRALEEAGTTWWIEYVPPDDPEAMRMCAARPPLRPDA
jgi:alkanesulfonate monooxygenase SsuD/methylene tetrahydromethanopterin reductase-like flavin-dependent oxidoreductase (luciferase family)